MSLISPAALDVLRGARYDGNWLLPMPKVERDLYREVDEVLTRLRGRWRKGKGHEFPYPAEMVVNAVVAAGVMPEKNPLQYFPTPRKAVKDLLEPNDMVNASWFRILEPEAGTGGFLTWLAKHFPLAQVDAVELDPINVALLRERAEREGWPAHWRYFHEDFLVWKPDCEYDAVVMNPPFADYEDHILKAWGHLRRNGELYSIIPAGMLAAKKTFKMEVLPCAEMWDMGAAFMPETGVSVWGLSAVKGQPYRLHECNGYSTRDGWEIIVTVESDYEAYTRLQGSIDRTINDVGQDLLGDPIDLRKWLLYWQDLVRIAAKDVFFLVENQEVLKDLWRHYATTG